MITTDRNNPDLGHGSDSTPVPQNKAYLVLSEEERAKGFVRPVRRSYVHVGPKGPSRELRPLTEDEKKRYGQYNYVGFEEYQKEHERASSAIGQFWTQAALDAAKKGGCNSVTTMGQALAETYARDPKFYGSTYCCACMMHRPVAEFVWDGTEERVGS
jgi:hypothetical protein